MSSQPHPKLTPEEYLALERAAEYKSEFYNGEMFAMSGASLPHNILVSQLNGLLQNALEGSGCIAVMTDMRLHIPATGLYTYPDVLVYCGKPQLLDGVLDTLLNPSVIGEVLSDSTEAFDRGKKFEHYQSIPSLQHYMLIAQDRIHVDLYTRQSDDRWLLSVANNLSDSIHLQSINCSFPLDRLYRNVLP